MPTPSRPRTAANTSKTGAPDFPVCEDLGTCYLSAALNLCFPFCNPLLQDCPQPDDACYPSGGDFFTCFPDGSGNEGQANDPCGVTNGCDKGLLCDKAASVGVGCPEDSIHCCTPFCEFPGGLCPNPDQQCMPYFDPMMLPAPELANIGACRVPS